MSVYYRTRRRLFTSHTHVVTFTVAIPSPKSCVIKYAFHTIPVINICTVPHHSQKLINRVYIFFAQKDCDNIIIRTWVGIRVTTQLVGIKTKLVRIHVVCVWRLTTKNALFGVLTSSCCSPRKMLALTITCNQSWGRNNIFWFVDKDNKLHFYCDTAWRPWLSMRFDMQKGSMSCLHLSLSPSLSHILSQIHTYSLTIRTSHLLRHNRTHWSSVRSVCFIMGSEFEAAHFRSEPINFFV